MTPEPQNVYTSDAIRQAVQDYLKRCTSHTWTLVEQGWIMDDVVESYSEAARLVEEWSPKIGRCLLAMPERGPIPWRFLNTTLLTLPADAPLPPVEEGSFPREENEQDGGHTPKALLVAARKQEGRPNTTDAEAAMTLLLYKLVTFAWASAWEDERLSAQERALLEGGWIANHTRYPLPSMPWGAPLERAITWTLPDGHRFKILVQDLPVTEEGNP